MSLTIPKAFFSYCRADSFFAYRLAEDLRSAGAQLWIDQLDIRAGERWDRAVLHALADCNTLLVILTPDAIASENVLDEVSFALDNARTVVPVLSRPCEVPLRLRANTSLYNVRTVAAIRVAVFARRDLLLEILALRHQWVVVSRSSREGAIR